MCIPDLYKIAMKTNWKNHVPQLKNKNKLMSLQIYLYKIVPLMSRVASVCGELTGQLIDP